MARVNALQTHAEALEYLKEVHVLVKAVRQRAGVRQSASVRSHHMIGEVVAEAWLPRTIIRRAASGR